MEHKVISHKDSFEIIFNKLKAREPFSFVRFGDGDHVIMYKDSIGTIVGGGNQFFVTNKFRNEIIECYNIQDEIFLIGTMLNDTSNYQMAKTNRNIDHSRLPEELVERKEMLAMSCLFEIFLNNIEKFKEFSKELRKTPTLFVCNYNHSNISQVYGSGGYVKVFPTNCYVNIDEWYQEILDKLNKVDKIVLSAGFSGKIIAKRLFKAGIKKIVLDVGSLSDAFIFNTDIRKQITGRTFMKQVKGRVNINTEILLTGKPFVAGKILLVKKKLEKPKRLKKKRIKR